MNTTDPQGAAGHNATETVPQTDDDSQQDVVDAGVAEQWLGAMEREWGLLAPNQRTIVHQAIRHGWIDYDADAGVIVYRLQRPFALENGAAFDQVVLREPTAGDLRKIGRNMFVSRSATDQVELAQATELTLRVVTVLDTDWPLGIAERIYRRDMRVLGALTGFFA